ncbi:hypothetical protein HZB90_04225, partial [archaeon]|nr:hypothetical protein [archaeon]
MKVRKMRMNIQKLILLLLVLLLAAINTTYAEATPNNVVYTGCEQVGNEQMCTFVSGPATGGSDYFPLGSPTPTLNQPLTRQHNALNAIITITVDDQTSLNPAHSAESLAGTCSSPSCREAVLSQARALLAAPSTSTSPPTGAAGPDTAAAPPETGVAVQPPAENPPQDFVTRLLHLTATSVGLRDKPMQGKTTTTISSMILQARAATDAGLTVDDLRNAGGIGSDTAQQRIQTRITLNSQATAFGVDATGTDQDVQGKIDAERTKRVAIAVEYGIAGVTDNYNPNELPQTVRDQLETAVRAKSYGIPPPGNTPAERAQYDTRLNALNLIIDTGAASADEIRTLQPSVAPPPTPPEGEIPDVNTVSAAGDGSMWIVEEDTNHQKTWRCTGGCGTPLFSDQSGYRSGVLSEGDHYSFYTAGGTRFTATRQNNQWKCTEGCIGNGQFPELPPPPQDRNRPGLEFITTEVVNGETRTFTWRMGA